MKYDQYEKELIELEDKVLGEIRDPTEKEKRYLQEAARNTLIKDKRINIRISSRDLNSLQRRANRYGMPYQTLISSILHRYVTGDLREKTLEPDGAGSVAPRRA